MHQLHCNGGPQTKHSPVVNVCLGLQAVELQEQQHVRADALSGGMKRRLQVALALLGSSRVILLGMAVSSTSHASATPHDHHLLQPRLVAVSRQHDQKKH